MQGLMSDEENQLLMPEMEPEPPLRRSICSNCERPERTCLCDFIPRPRITSNVHVIILMHPKVHSTCIICLFTF